MRHFELVAILSPMLSPQESAAAWDDIKSFIANREGEFTGEQRWGTRRLAYPIRKGNYNFLEGAYYLSSFTVETAFNRELETYLRLDERVLRSLVMRCDGPLEDKPAPGPLTAPSRYIPPGRGPRRNDGGGPIPEGAGGFDRRGDRGDRGYRGDRGDRSDRGPRPPMEERGVGGAAPGGAPGVGGPPSGPVVASVGVAPAGMAATPSEMPTPAPAVTPSTMPTPAPAVTPPADVPAAVAPAPEPVSPPVAENPAAVSAVVPEPTPEPEPAADPTPAESASVEPAIDEPAAAETPSASEPTEQAV